MHRLVRETNAVEAVSGGVPQARARALPFDPAPFYGQAVNVKSGLKDAMDLPLLDASEEKALGTRVQAWVALEAARAELGGCGDERLAASLNITTTELKALGREGVLARERMIVSNLRLVYALAARYQQRLPRPQAFSLQRDGNAVELGDLVAEGALGLVKAVDRFDPGRGFRFSTYATWWIRQGITDAMRKRDVCCGAGASGRSFGGASSRGAFAPSKK